MEPLIKAGAVGFSDDGDPVKTAELMAEALEISKAVQFTDNRPLRRAQTADRPEGEEKIVARDLAVAEKTKGWVHIAHVSTAGAVELIRQAKKQRV